MRRIPSSRADPGFPTEDLTQPGVIGVASAHALGTRDVPFGYPNTGGVGHDVGKLVDSDHTVLSEIQRQVIVRPHQLVEPDHAIVDIAERTRLLSVAPNFYFMIVR